LAHPCPLGQVWHTAPPEPHAAVEVPGWQAPTPSTQPLVQPQWPLTHSAAAPLQVRQPEPLAPQVDVVFPGV